MIAMLTSSHRRLGQLARLAPAFISFWREELATVSSPQRLRAVWGSALHRNSFYLIANSVAGAGLGFVFWIVVARVYAPEELGLASALISAALLLAFVSSLGLGYGLIRFIPSAGARRSLLVNSSLTLCVLTALIAALVFLGGLPWWSPALLPVRQHPLFMVSFVALVAASGASFVMSGAFLSRRRGGLVLSQGLIFNLGKLILVVTLVFGSGAFRVFASWSLAMVVALLVSLLLLLPRAQPGYRPAPALSLRESGGAVRFALVNYVGDGLWQAPTWLLPLMVVNLLGAQANASFYVSWATAALLFVIPLGVSQSLFVEGSHGEARLAHDLRRSLRLLVALLLPAILFLALGGDRVLLLFGREYSEAGGRLFWVLIPSALPVSVNLLYLSVARVERRLRPIVLVTGAVAAGTLGLGYVLLPLLGITGAGLGWLLSHSAVAGVLALRWARNRRLPPATSARGE